MNAPIGSLITKLANYMPLGSYAIYTALLVWDLELDTAETSLDKDMVGGDWAEGRFTWMYLEDDDFVLMLAFTGFLRADYYKMYCFVLAHDLGLEHVDSGNITGAQERTASNISSSALVGCILQGPKPAAKPPCPPRFLWTKYAYVTNRRQFRLCILEIEFGFLSWFRNQLLFSWLAPSTRAYALGWHLAQ
ncbi:hypothetical protein BG000_008944 [Podila horticola]|nr:hypothetical protein BG000_008944 [Podila horticola]